MCCFTGVIAHVSGTRIFARPADDGRQLLAYDMRLEVLDDVAMVLPLPVPPGTAEDGVRFIALHDYPEFFSDLQRGFPTTRKVVHGTRGGIGGPAPAAPPLAVQRVGAFEASFVPRAADFARLDARFRLPEGALARLPAYADYGFAVFKFRTTAPRRVVREIGDTPRVHPLALEFPRRAPDELFFPTVHVHDGEVHAAAAFDHSLFCQLGEGQSSAGPDWHRSAGVAANFTAPERSSGLIAGHRGAYRKDLVGTFPNRDTVLRLGTDVTPWAGARRRHRRGN